MRIIIYIHPESKESFWSRFSLRAVAAEILRKRYTPEYIKNIPVTEVDFDKYFKSGEKKVVMYIGFSPKDTLNDLAYLSTHGVHTLMLNYGYEEFSGTCSKVLLNCRIVPGGEHNEASWERQIPFFMDTLLYDQGEI